MFSSFFLLVLLLSIGALVSGFEFDHDANQELCKKETAVNPGICTSNSTMWFSCPISCAQLLSGGRGTMAEERSDAERFYELRTKRASTAGSSSDDGSGISLEENEGYITMYAVLPMLPGMAQYYYNAIEHIAHVYKYTLMAMILPLYNTAEERDDTGLSTNSSSSTAILRSILDSRKDAGNNNKKNVGTKSIVLEGHDANRQESDNEILEYLRTREVVAGTLDPGNFEHPGGSDVGHYNDSNNLALHMESQ